ncbi:MAG TPA: signal peptidase I [Clostridiales bacterium]|nr:signal peptidase I [Clostridiales bacterium]
MDLYLDSESKKENKKLMFEIIIFLIALLLVILFAYLIVHYALESTTVYEESMSPTLLVEDEVLINKFKYRLSNPERFDVIVFIKTDREHSYYNIKRIIGLPGETIQITDDGILVNGQVLEDIVEVEDMHNYGLAKEVVTLDENEYFVLGDNRNSSEDSRFANVGNVLRDDILGKAWIRTNNFNFISKLNLQENNPDEEER